MTDHPRHRHPRVEDLPGDAEELPEPPHPSTQPRTLQYHGTAGARPMSAGHVMLVGAIALGLAALLNADSLSALANRQPFGWKRTVARGVIAPVRGTSHLVGLDEPRRAIVEATGRDPDQGNGEVEEVTVTTRPAAAPPPVIRVREPTKAAPLKLWVGGDSMAQEFGAAVVEQAGERGTVDATLDYRISTGLTRPDYFNWPLHLRDEVLPGKPEVIVIIFGANDGQPMEVDGTPYKVRTPQWQAEYRKRVATTMDLLEGEKRLVIWVGLPRMRDSEFDERMQILNGIYESEAASRPWISFLDSAPVLSPPGGGYSAYLPDGSGGQELARQSDGIHLQRFGANLVSDAVYERLDAEIAKGAKGGAPGTTTAPPTTTSTPTTGG